MDLKLFHEKMLYPTVRVTVNKGGGSGTVIFSELIPGLNDSYETYILTNHHVVADAIKIEKKWDSLLGRDRRKDVKSKVNIEFFEYEYDSWSPRTFSRRASIINYDVDIDIAILKLDDTRKVDYVANLFPKDEEKKRIKMDMPVVAVGASLLHQPIHTDGKITCFDDIIDNYPYWMQSGATIYGNSGGAVFLRETAEFIGIPSRISVTWGGDAITHMSYFIPIVSIYKFIDDNLLYFLYDKDYDSKYCEKLRKERRKEDEKALILSEGRGESEDEEKSD